MAVRGAQLIFLVRDIKSSWLAEYIEDLRNESNNHLIYAEECDLESLYSVRKFATKWLDNSPPRRLDMLICLAGLALPPFSERTATLDEGVETQYAVNYLSHYHLLTLLEPALKVQPFDRDVRVILATCVSSVMGDFDEHDLEFKTRAYPVNRPWRVFGNAKLQLSLFAYEFQRRLNTYVRPDNKQAPNVRTIVVDPGLMRTPSFNRFASMGTIWGLVLYLFMWPIWWLFLKSPYGGSQTVLHAIMNPEFEDSTEVQYLSECKTRPPPPLKSFKDEDLQKRIFDKTAEMIHEVEKRGALERKRREVSIKVEETRQKKSQEKEEKERKEKEELKKRIEKLDEKREKERAAAAEKKEKAQSAPVKKPIKATGSSVKQTKAGSRKT